MAITPCPWPRRAACCGACRCWRRSTWGWRGSASRSTSSRGLPAPSGPPPAWARPPCWSGGFASGPACCSARSTSTGGCPRCSTAGQPDHWALRAVVAAAIGGGVTLQALTSAGLGRPLLASGGVLRSVHQAVPFLIVTGPASCLLSATTGVAARWAVGDLPADEVFANWFTWWMGDSIGVLLLVPLTLLALPEAKPRRWRAGPSGGLPACRRSGVDCAGPSGHPGVAASGHLAPDGRAAGRAALPDGRADQPARRRRTVADRRTQCQLGSVPRGRQERARRFRRSSGRPRPCWASSGHRASGLGQPGAFRIEYGHERPDRGRDGAARPGVRSQPRARHRSGRDHVPV